MEKKIKATEKKIREVHNYFRRKLTSGQFKITKIDDHAIELLIDEKYLFTIWVYSGEDRVSIYSSIERSFMDITFRDIDKKKIYSILEKPYKDCIKNDLIEKKRKELQVLESKIKSIEE